MTTPSFEFIREDFHPPSSFFSYKESWMFTHHSREHLNYGEDECSRKKSLKKKPSDRFKGRETGSRISPPFPLILSYIDIVDDIIKNPHLRKMTINNDLFNSEERLNKNNFEDWYPHCHCGVEKMIQTYFFEIAKRLKDSKAQAKILQGCLITSLGKIKNILPCEKRSYLTIFLLKDKEIKQQSSFYVFKTKRKKQWKETITNIGFQPLISEPCICHRIMMITSAKTPCTVALGMLKIRQFYDWSKGTPI
ncbi:hypothetical protein H8356DRAFT_1422195 [Neocallimastix lanati (nom. inval.)]|nr:hypothetical protein H8356DRAFT_1422195 [Neocallimastix sp. JGI-2020a]